MIAQAIKVQRLVEEDKRRLVDENAHLRQSCANATISPIWSAARPMREIYEQVTQVAGTNATVLIRGESGTGKELIAHAIHYSSLREEAVREGERAALPESLIESELFGHERGRSRAPRRARRALRAAEGGTLFLDRSAISTRHAGRCCASSSSASSSASAAPRRSRRTCG